MKEFDETEALKRMVIASGRQYNEDSADEACEVLDLIYDYYDENGELEIVVDGDDFDDDVESIASYVTEQLDKTFTTDFSHEEVKLMVAAELQYEDELLKDL